MTKTEAARWEEKQLAFCRQNQLFAPNDRVIAACSGGADSVALLLFLLAHQNELGITLLGAAHVDHGLRPSAGRDAAFVRQLCAAHGLAFYLKSADPDQIPPHPGEDWARQLRYDFFERLAARENARIATAHTASDQAETLLLRLARGTGLHGAAGIPARRGPFVRPLLEAIRAETEGYCAFWGQCYQTDETNLTDVYARNRVRQAALPALETVNPAATAALARFCAQAREMDSWLETLARALLDEAAAPSSAYPAAWHTAPLLQAPPPVRHAALRQLARQMGSREQFVLERLVRLEGFMRSGHGAERLGDGVRLAVHGGLLCWETATAPPGPAPAVAARPGVYSLPGGYRLELELLDYENFIKIGPVHKKDLKYWADYAKIQNNLTLRTRLPGDRYCPRGRSLSKSLKGLWQEQGIPAEQRPLIPLLAQGSRVVWLWEDGFARGLAPGPDSQTVLRAAALPSLCQEEVE